MSKVYFPFDAGAGSGVLENQWSLMGRVWRKDGVISGLGNNLEVYADSSGMQVKVKSGGGWLKGHYYASDAVETLAIATADVTYDRIDRVVLQVNWLNNIVDVVVITGTPAGSPTAPALTQTTSVWEISLAQILVDHGASTIAAGKVTDERKYCNRYPISLIIGDGMQIIPTGVAGFIRLPNHTVKIVGIELVANASGNLVLDLWVDTYGNFPPTVADTITAAAKPTLSAAQKGSDFTLSGWTVSFEGGKWLGINVDSAATIKQATLALIIEDVV